MHTRCQDKIIKHEQELDTGQQIGVKGDVCSTSRISGGGKVQQNWRIAGI